MSPPVRPYREGNPFAAETRSYRPNNPFLNDGEAERERHARLAAANLQRDPTDSGVGGFGQTILKATNAINPLQDEIAGLVGGAGALVTGKGLSGARQAYVETRDAARAPVHEFQERNPKAAVALDVAGALAVPLPFSKVNAVTRFGRALQAGARGATAGAAYGFAGAEGDVGSQLAQTVLGGAAGGVLGAAVQPVAEVVGGRLAGRAARTERRAADVVGQTAKLDDQTLATLPQAGGGRNVAESTDRVGVALARRVAGEGGRPATDLVEATAARAATGPDEVLTAAARSLGQSPRDPNTLIRSVRDAQRQIGPQFEAVLDEPVTITPALKDLLTKHTTLVRQAFIRGRKVAMERVGGDFDQPVFGRPIPDFLERAPRARGGQFPAMGGSTPPRVKDVVPLRTLKVIKEGLDDMASTPEAARGLSRQRSAAASSRVSRIRDAVVEQVKPYGEALEQYAAQAENVDLLKLGLKGFGTTAKWKGRTIRVTPDELGRIAQSVRPEGQGYLAMGLLEAVRRKGVTTLSQEQLAVIRAVAPQGTQALEDALTLAGIRGQLAGEVATIARGAATREAPSLAQQGATEILVGAKRAGAQHTIRSLFQRRDNPDVRALIGEYLMSQDNAVRARLLRGAGANAATVRAGAAAGRVAGAGVSNAFRGGAP